MKKTLLRLTILLVSSITLSVLALYTVIHTQYAPKLLAAAIHQFTPYQLEAAKVRYLAPLQLELSDVTLKREHKSVSFENLTLWLNQHPWQNGELVFDSILAQGASLELTQLDTSFVESVKIHQLALKHIDISSPTWSARDVNLQIENPSWQSPQQWLPYGDIQLSMQQLYIQGEALDKVLIDMRYQASNSTVFGSSFRWRGANISGQAEQYSQGWSLVNVTIDKLDLPDSIQLEQLDKTFRSLKLPIADINSLDILNSSFSFQDWQFDNLDASVEQLTFNRPIWQQQNGYASFNADSIRHQELHFLSPKARLAFRQNRIIIEELDSDFKQGRVQLKGQFSPQSAQISQLKLSNIKWLERTNWLLSNLDTFSSSLKALTIEQLKIDNAQLIQVEQAPFWQLSGLYIEGNNLTLVDQNKSGLLEGTLEMSTNSANLDKLVTTQMQLLAHAQNSTLTLERALIPLEQGYIEASGTWDRHSLSAPWQLTLHADGLPLGHSFLHQVFPFSLTGFAEVELELNGLSGDYAMFSHSLSGHINTEIYQAAIEAKSLDKQQIYHYPLQLREVKFHADRGRLSVTSQTGKTQIGGEVDLTEPQFATLLFKAQHQCSELWSDILNRVNVIKQNCAANSQSDTNTNLETNNRRENSAPAGTE